MENLKAKGNLEIWKIHNDGKEELHYSEHNVITSGMGVGMAHLFTGSGAGKISDYQILNFQVGTGGDVTDYGVSTYELQTPAGTAAYLTAGSDLLVESLAPLKDGVVATSEYFVRIPFSNIQKVTANSVRFNLVIDSFSLVGTTLNEVGLFMRNPRGLVAPTPILVAYRPFTSLKKTSTFTLVLKWTISF